MATSKLPIALTAAVLIGGSALIGVQESAFSSDSTALARLREEDAALPALVRQNRQLAVSSLHARSLLDDASAIPGLERQLADLEDAGKAAAGPASAAGLGASTLKAAGPYDISKLDIKPRILRQGRPAPARDIAAAAGSGEVLVDFTVGADGSVSNTAVVSSSNRAFEEPAIDAVSQWVFSPGQVAGQNVSVHMRVPIVFSPSSEPRPFTPITWF